MLFGETAVLVSGTEHTDTVRTPQETHHVSAKETNQLMLFIVGTVRNTDTLCGQNAELSMLKQAVCVVTSVL
jgi:hypothetical protein